MTAHDFGECLAFSHEAEDYPFWAGCYGRWFPGHAARTSHRADGQLQRLGVDRSVVLATGKQVFVDEKVRRRNRNGRVYDDVALEYVANDRTGSPGWVRKALLVDFIAYAIAPLGVAYLLPVLQLQAAWQEHGADWIGKFKRIEAKNKGYSTISVGVPHRDLFAAMGNFHRAKFEPLELIEGA